MPRKRGLDMTQPVAAVDPNAERIAQLLSIAKSTFSQKGFAATTMDDIAQVAGMSKKTLYKLFDSKSDLFRAMLLNNLPQLDFRGDPDTTGSATHELQLALRHIADIVFAPDEIALHRLIIGERKQSPAIARIFIDVILGRGGDGIVDSIRRVHLRPALHDLTAKTVAEMILGAVFGNDHFRLLVDDEFRVNRRAVNKRIDAAIATFCEDVA